MSNEGAKVQARVPTIEELWRAEAEIAMLARAVDTREELLRKLLNDKADILRNLTSTQERCSELLLENREIRKRYAEAVGMKPPVDLLVRIAKLEEALLWCGGSSDFGPGGKAEEGWTQLVLPLLSVGRSSTERST